MKGIKAFKKIKQGVFETGGIGGSKKTTWKVGDKKTVSGKIELCGNGFHFFREKDMVFGIEFFGENTVFCEVEAGGNIVSDTYKCVTNEIEIIRYIPTKEWKKKIDKSSNSGDSNSGNRNSGYYNSGNRNSGYYNSGDSNSGDSNSGYNNSGNRNSGNRNSGYYNSGNRNSGDYNSGDSNSGYNNSGDRNSGDYNSGDYNSGDYNSGEGYINYFCEKKKYFFI